MSPDTTKNMEQLEAELEEKQAEANRWAFKHGEALAEIDDLKRENRALNLGYLLLIVFCMGALTQELINRIFG